MEDQKLTANIYLENKLRFISANFTSKTQIQLQFPNKNGTQCFPGTSNQFLDMFGFKGGCRFGRLLLFLRGK